jgi:sarcosine oxidase subunit gamma
VLAVHQALGLDLPVQACTTVANHRLRVVWVGPDDWFVFGPQGEQAKLAEALRLALGEQHAAVTDVSSGYFVVSLAGLSARDLLAQGCPMDFHPNAFHVDQAATTHFHKVGITVWKSGDASRFELLVRRSFIDHFWQLVVAGSREFGITETVAA